MTPIENAETVRVSRQDRIVKAVAVGRLTGWNFALFCVLWFAAPLWVAAKMAGIYLQNASYDNSTARPLRIAIGAVGAGPDQLKAAVI